MKSVETSRSTDVLQKVHTGKYLYGWKVEKDFQGKAHEAQALSKKNEYSA